jgi:hypothetical protein
MRIDLSDVRTVIQLFRCKRPDRRARNRTSQSMGERERMDRVVRSCHDQSWYAYCRGTLEIESFNRFWINETESGICSSLRPCRMSGMRPGTSLLSSER